MIRMLRMLRKVAKASEGKTATELEKLIKEFVSALHHIEKKPGRGRLKILGSDIEQIEGMDVGPTQLSKKALSGLLKAGKKVRTAFKKCHRASGKELLVKLARSSLSDAVIPGIDAMVPTLSEGTVAYPPLFGSGGTDGRLEFTNTFLHASAKSFKQKAGCRRPNRLLG